MHNDPATVQLFISLPAIIANMGVIIKMIIDARAAKIERKAINDKLTEASVIRQSIVEKVDNAAQNANVAATKAAELHDMTTDLKQKVEAHMASEEAARSQ